MCNVAIELLSKFNLIVTLIDSFYFSDDVVYNQSMVNGNTIDKRRPDLRDELGYIAPPNRKLPPVPGSNYNTCDRVKRGLLMIFFLLFFFFSFSFSFKKCLARKFILRTFFSRLVESQVLISNTEILHLWFFLSCCFYLIFIIFIHSISFM